ncbi:fasciclin [Nostoc minutum NIES-26]|uniref:Fasciclin n=1 Tax=Nostoc minutum NIES-26 TaxID=1844469 RepID=A0A367RRV4_9NOSO|nr:fasciclin [Nostoc minutum NIES-26]
MNTQKSRSLIKILAIAVVASLLISLPTLAQFHPNFSPQSSVLVTQAKSTGTIVDIASGNKSLSTLVKALKAAGLVETLSGKGPFTVFAPTNDAFAALPKGTLAKLLKPENKALLQKILTYHVVSGAIDSKSINSAEFKTLEGSPVEVKAEKDHITVNRARVTTPDIKASNGVIHVIDGVLHPPDVEL